MADRIRHCVECPECRTRYLIGFSPYSNGSWLVSLPSNALEEYRLFCSCCRPAVCSAWKRNELASYAVSSRAHARGYGSPEEIWPFRQEASQFRGGLRESERILRPSWPRA